MESFPSRKVYEDRINDFAAYATADNSELSLESKLVNSIPDTLSEERQPPYAQSQA